MFSEAIEKIAGFTRPIHSIQRTYGGRHIIPGAATLFFVNELGYAVTCKHVMDMIAASDQLNNQFNQFKTERDKLPRDNRYHKNLAGLEHKYHYNPETTVQAKHSFVDCADAITGFTWHLHPKYDLAILKFNDYQHLLYQGYAVFKKDTTQIRQGEYLCRLGFPFPEFSNFSYNEAKDDIEWNNNGTRNSPRFPLDGMLTRFLAENNQLYGIELSTPGLRGQSGGPLFNKESLVYGMQFSTKHLHLGFDLVEKEIMLNNKLKKVTDYSFIHLGQCIHADIIKSFLKEKNVKFYEA